MKIGDRVRIVYMDGEPQYEGKEGVVEHISKDPWGETAYYGTWGGCAIYPTAGDRVEIIGKEEKQ